jgi:hypothetical protein
MMADESTTSDMDGGWKQLIEEYLEGFFGFFFPAVHAEIDFGRGYEYLDKELAQIVAGAAVGRRRVDKLIQVHWKSGRQDLILLHVEVQARREADFARRMCLYNFRIWDRYNKPVVSLALLVDGDARFRPARYEREQAGCRLEFVFPSVKLLDFKTEEELAADPSPFAIAALVQLRKLQAGRSAVRRYAYKVALVRELYGRSYRREDVLKLLRFMDYLLKLPAGLSTQFRHELELIEEELKMPYLTTWERKALEEGLEKGRQEGILQGAKELLRQALEIRFGEVPTSLLEQIQRCQDADSLRALHQQVLMAQSLDDVRLA